MPGKLSLADFQIERLLGEGALAKVYLAERAGAPCVLKISQRQTLEQLHKRNDALIEKVQNNPERYTIVDMTISAGSAMSKIMTLATGAFWDIDERAKRAI